MMPRPLLVRVTQCLGPQGLKTGLSENSVFSVFHPDAVDLFSVYSNLEKVGWWALFKGKLDE